MKKNPLLFGVAALFLLLGAGCSSKDETPQDPEVPLVDTTVQQQAYLFCTQKGYEIQIRYEAAQNRNVAYCVFNDEKECESIAFMQDRCPAESRPTPEDERSQMFEPVPGDEFPLRLCDLKAQPVCGTDGKTYTNGCIAEFLGVQIAEHNACEGNSETGPNTANTSPIVDVSVLPERNSRTGSGSSRTDSNDRRTPTPGTTESANTNAWVEIPLSLLQSTANTNARIDRCTQNGQTTFFVHDDFPTLYNTKGEVICYPEHDINNACPSYITSGTYTNSCTRVSQ